MKKSLLILFSSLFLSTTLSTAQQQGFNWRIGISGGYSNYYGDLSPHRLQGLSNWEAIHHLFYYNPQYVDELSYKISVEKQLSASIGLMFSYGQYTFAMSDRYIQRDGTLMLDNPNFERALNFQNISRDMGLSFVFNTDNGIILPANSFIAPYLTIGGGLLDFEVRGDLLSDEGAMYNYATTEMINDGMYETDLSRLRTERPDGYSTGAFYANFGLGVRLRLGPRIELFAQSDFIHAFTDYLDDVSGPYRESYDNNFQAYAARPGTNVVSLPNPLRGDPNSPNDWIIYHGIGLKLNFGATNRTFSVPRISTSYPDYTITSTRTTQRSAPKDDTMEPALTDRQAELPIGKSYTYFNNIQIVPDHGFDSLAYRSQMLDWEQKIQSRENLILSGRLQRQDLQNIQNEIIRESNLLIQDTVLATSSRDSLLILSQEDQLDIRYRLDSIQRREGEIRSEIDSLQNLRKNYIMQPSTYTLPRGLDRILWRQDEEMTHLPLEQDEITGRGDTTVLPPQALRSSSPAAPGEPTQIAASSPPDQTIARGQDQQRAAYAQQLEQRIRNMELENQRLQAQQQAIRQQPSETIYITPRTTSGISPGRNVVPRNRQTPMAYTPPVDDINRRVRDRSPRALPFIGLFRSRNVVPPASPAQKVSEQETIELDEEMKESLRQLGQSINLALLGISLATTAEEEIPQELPEEEEMEVIDEGPEIIADSLVIDDPEFRLLKSKVEVFFDVNQVQPAMEEMKKLASLVDFIKDNEDFKLSLRGFADNTGNVTYNLKLIESRIEEVKNVLIKLYGVPPTQIESEVGGQIVRGAKRSANENDRKVEVRIEGR